MFRGRPHRGGFPRPYGPPTGVYSREPHHGHSPRPGPGRPLPAGPYREDRERHGYHHGHPEDYRRSPPRRSPPRRRYSSPGSSSYRGNEPPPREHSSKRPTPSPTRGDLSIDHSLVITVGNELTGSQPPRGSREPEHHYERDYHKGDPHYKHSSGNRPAYEKGSEPRRSPSRGRSRARSHSRGRGRSRSRSRGKSRGRSKSRHRSRSRSRGCSRGRSKSRHRSSRSRERSRSRSRSRGRSRVKSRSRSGSSSSSGSSSGRGSAIPPLPSRARRPDEFLELEMARRRKELEEMLGAPTKSILKKRVDSETDSPAAVQSSDSPVDVPGENQSASLSRETERFLSVVTKGMESGLFTSMLGEMADQPHEQRVRAMINAGQYEEILSMVKQDQGRQGVSGGGEFLLPHERVRQDTEGFSRILGAIGNVPAPQEKRKGLTDIEDEEKFLYGDEEEGDKEKEPGQAHSAATQARAPPLHGQPEPFHYGDGRTEISKYHDSKPEVAEYPGGREFVQRHLSQAGAAHELLSEAYGGGAADSPYHHGGSTAGEDRLDAALLRGSHQQVQPDVRYHHRGQTAAAAVAAVAAAQNNGGQTGAPQQQPEPEEYHPGLDPRESKDREEVAEYEKIQDLLKAIGLDLGVAEISKMAARTQERLHGKKPPPGSSSSSSRRGERLQERRASSGSYNRRKSHSSTSSSRSRSRSPSPSPSKGRSRGRSRGRKRSPESERRSASPPPPLPRPSRQVLLGESLTAPPPAGGGRAELDADDKNWGIPVVGKGGGGAQPRITVSMNPPPNLAPMPQPAAAAAVAMGAHAMSGYQSQSPAAYPMPHPNYPPPGYGQYESYMPYMHQGWPMYPPPTMMPPHSPVEEAPAAARPYLRVIETVSMENRDSRSSQTAGKASKPDSDGFTSQPAKEEMSQSEEENQASQKEKVIEEREKLKKDRDVRMKKKEYLMKELERLRKQQGELLRKKRREKDGHKDPLLAELGRLQEEVIAQVSRLRREHIVAEQKRAELDKVALVLGLRGSDKHRRESRTSGEQERPPERAPAKAPAPAPAAPTTTAAPSSSSAPPSKATSALGSSSEKQKPTKSQHSTSIPEKSPEQYEYYDSGNHWCKNCNTVCGSMFDFFTHLHSKSHRKTLDPYDRPWAANSTDKEKKRTPGEKIVRPAKGCEFLVPVTGFYCQLCEEFFGDQICAEDHVTCHKHNAKYKKRMDEHPMYEQRRNLDRQAGLSVATDGWERKHSNELKRKLDTEETSGTPEHRPSRTPESRPSVTPEYRPSSPSDEPPPSHSRKSYGYRDREEKPSRNHKEETYSSRRDEKSPGHREDHPYGRKEERRSSVKEEREGRRRTPVRDVKSEAQKPTEPAEKTANVAKVICRPSPSILAKVRRRNEEAVKRNEEAVKRNEEAAKSAASASPFGKFSWKKTEKEKEDEVEKEEKAMESRTEEENSGDDGGDKEEGKGALAKSKTIAIKLSGKTIIPPPNAWVPFASAQPAATPAKKSPLNAPMMVLRKSSRIAASKPPPLKTFLSIRPPEGNSNKPLPVVKPPANKDAMLTPDLISKAFGGEEVVLKTPEVPVETPPPVSVKNQQNPSPAVKKVPPAKRMAFAEPMEPPPPGMMSFESDVSAPGVPESEQTMAVLVCPPPLHMTMSEGSKRSDGKPKSSMAAAKAQDLYDIFYSSGGGGRSSSGSDLLAATKPPKSAEAATKGKDSGAGADAPETESKSPTDAIPSAQTPEIPKPDKDIQMEVGDLDMFTFNFE